MLGTTEQHFRKPDHLAPRFVHPYRNPDTQTFLLLNFLNGFFPFQGLGVIVFCNYRQFPPSLYKFLPNIVFDIHYQRL